ncbi:MAG: hypothetical protein J6P82_00755 [Bacteroidales bacterium]|nr:hypothetical protein [Bacteroidales bacterium]
MKITGTVTYVGTLELRGTYYLLTIIVTCYECRFQPAKGAYSELASYGINLYNKSASECQLRCGDVVSCDYSIVSHLVQSGDSPPRMLTELRMNYYAVLPSVAPNYTTRGFRQPRQESLDQD